MTGSSVRARWWIPRVLALAALGTGCTVTDDFVQDVGTTRIFFVDPDLGSQSVSDLQSRSQAAWWSISEACLDLDGDVVDLANLTEGCAVAADDCEFVDSVNASPYSVSHCAGGLVIRASPDEPQSIRLTVTFTMNVWKAEPPGYLLTKADRDDDGWLNEADNCPWVKNADQRDENLDGIGDRCQLLTSTARYVLDSDGDGVRDSADNCVWQYNPAQENSVDVTGKGIDDGIGDVCTAIETGVVDASSGTAQVSVTLGPVELFQARNRHSYVTVDFADALDCGDWTGQCSLMVGRLRLCAAADATSAMAGCR